MLGARILARWRNEHWRKKNCPTARRLEQGGAENEKESPSCTIMRIVEKSNPYTFNTSERTPGGISALGFTPAILTLE